MGCKHKAIGTIKCHKCINQGHAMLAFCYIIHAMLAYCHIPKMQQCGCNCWIQQGQTDFVFTKRRFY